MVLALAVFTFQEHVVVVLLPLRHAFPSLQLDSLHNSAVTAGSFSCNCQESGHTQQCAVTLGRRDKAPYNDAAFIELTLYAQCIHVACTLNCTHSPSCTSLSLSLQSDPLRWWLVELQPVHSQGTQRCTTAVTTRASGGNREGRERVWPSVVVALRQVEHPRCRDSAVHDDRKYTQVRVGSSFALLLVVYWYEVHCGWPCIARVATCSGEAKHTRSDPILTWEMHGFDEMCEICFLHLPPGLL